MIKAKVRRKPETTKYFSSFRTLFSPLSCSWEKTRTDASTEPKNAVLFYLFCKTHLSNIAHKT